MAREIVVGRCVQRRATHRPIPSARGACRCGIRVGWSHDGILTDRRPQPIGAVPGRSLRARARPIPAVSWEVSTGSPRIGQPAGLVIARVCHRSLAINAVPPTMSSTPRDPSRGSTRSRRGGLGPVSVTDTSQVDIAIALGEANFLRLSAMPDLPRVRSFSKCRSTSGPDPWEDQRQAISIELMV